MNSRIAARFYRAIKTNEGPPSFAEVKLPASMAAGELSKSEIMAAWEQIKYTYLDQIIVVAEGSIIACSTIATTVPRELIWLCDSAQDRLDAKIAHLRK